MITKTTATNRTKDLFFIILGIVLIIAIVTIRTSSNKTAPSIDYTSTDETRIISGTFDKNSFKTDAEWKKILTTKQYDILRLAGTEMPFTGELDNEKRPGTYFSAGCDKALFRSEQKYDSGTGWPSFWAPIEMKNLVLRKEMAPDGRIEVLDTCGNHLGHVFDDGPEPTGKRYCMNSVALKFVPDK